MTDAVETMAFAGTTPWHGKGFPVNSNMTPQEMLVASKTNWTVSKKPIYFEKAGKMEIVPDRFALIRDSDESCLSLVGSKWKVNQNEKTFDFFSKYVKEGKMGMETAGSLWSGRYVWALARLGSDFAIGKDEVRGYVLLASPHVFGRSMLIQTTAIRVVCWNTFSAAVGSNLKGKGGNVFRIPHSQEFNDTAKAAAALTLGLATEQMVEFKEVATLLSRKKATAPKTEEFFCEVLKFDPKDAVKKKDGEDKEPRMLSKFRAALTHAPGQEMPSALGTWWGNFNAITHVIDHEVGRDRDTALKAAWVGGHANLKRDALKLAIDYATKSKAA
jgi:phage/plasmid-like protein (TIGR03299 family)